MTDASAGWPEGAREAVRPSIGKQIIDHLQTIGWDTLWRHQKAIPDDCWPIDIINAKVAAALAAQAGAMRDIARIEVAADMRSQAEGLGGTWMATMQMLADRLLGGHAMDALAAALAEARKAGLREAAAKVRVHAAAAKQCSDEGDVIHRIRAEYLAKAFALNAAADDIDAAILALAEEATDG